MHQACHCCHIIATLCSWKCWFLPADPFVKLSVVPLTSAAVHACFHGLHSALLNFMRIVQADAQELHAVNITQQLAQPKLLDDLVGTPCCIQAAVHVTP